MPAQNPDIDILEMPVEGLAAYWLSIKRLLDKKNGSVLDEERAHTREPFIKYLLEAGFMSLPPVQARELMLARAETLLTEYGRKLAMMRLAALAAASGENPRLTFLRMQARYSLPPIAERQAFDLANELVATLKDSAFATKHLFVVDHKQKPDQLMVRLLAALILARRGGRESLAPLLTSATSTYFTECLGLVLDNLDTGFIANHAHHLARAILADTRRKMTMAADMCLAIASRQSYEHVFAVAKAYLA